MKYICTLITSNLSVLHPRHKLSYFKKAKWEGEWIKAAMQLVRAEFDTSYKSGLALDNEVRARCMLFLFHLMLLYV